MVVVEISTTLSKVHILHQFEHQINDKNSKKETIVPNTLPCLPYHVGLLLGIHVNSPNPRSLQIGRGLPVA